MKKLVGKVFATDLGKRVAFSASDHANGSHLGSVAHATVPDFWQQSKRGLICRVCHFLLVGTLLDSCATSEKSISSLLHLVSWVDKYDW